MNEDESEKTEEKDHIEKVAFVKHLILGFFSRIQGLFLKFWKTKWNPIKALRWLRKRSTHIAAVASVIAALTGIIAIWPKSAKPDARQFTLYMSGTANNFLFVCQFTGANDGMGPCSVTDVEILLEECEFEMGHSLVMEQPLIYPGGPVVPRPAQPLPERTIATELPVSIGKLSKEEIVIVGKGRSETLQIQPEKVDVNVTFQTRATTVVIRKTATVIQGIKLKNFTKK